MKAAIFLNSGNYVNNCEKADLVICADGGYKYCPIKPDIIIGDMDSLKNIPNIKTEIYNPQKDYTDGEICVNYAVEHGATEIDFYGITGGRQDHILGNLSSMAYANSLNIQVKAIEKDCTIYIKSVGHVELDAPKNSTISIIPYGGDAFCNNSKNLFYPINNLTLSTIHSRGISNVCTSTNFSFDVINGVILIFIQKSL